jgi:hypothetical protein
MVARRTLPDMMFPTFHLAKWYMDCVSADGEVFLAYRAELRWRAVHLHYASVLGGCTSMRESPEPVWCGGVLQWDAPALGISATWHAIDPPARESLLDGACDWNCLVPRARAEVRLPGRTIRGLGYAEHLTMTVPPWSLPISELRWGRFLSETDSVVWIEWSGAKSASLRWRNGVRSQGERVEIQDQTTLREGKLVETALRVIPNVHKLFPARILGMRESKWRSRAAFRAAGGWAIHEVVHWP